MTQKCESCSAPADTYLCGRCVTDLRDMLGSLVSCGTVTDQILKTDEKTGELKPFPRHRKLPGMLEHLRGYAVGQARRGEQARRVHREPDTLDGDSTLASHIDALPDSGDDDEPDLARARRRREQITLNRALAAGGVNTSASRLLAEMHDALGQWARHIARAHNLTIGWRTTTGFAHFLSLNTPKVALDADAADLHHRVRGFLRRIENTLNPAVPRRECGPCPTVIVESRGRRRCATSLTADRDASEVTCPNCDSTFRVEKLIQDLWNDVDEWHLTRSEILQVLKVLDQPLSVEVFKKLCTRGKKIGNPPVTQQLHARGWRRPGEKVGEWHDTRESPGDKPVYRLTDVRPFLPGKKPTASASA